MDCSSGTPTVQHIICHSCASPFLSMSIFVFSSQFLKLFVLPQLPLSSLWFLWFLSTHNIHKKVIDGSLLPTPKNYFFILLINCSVNFSPGHCHFALPCSILWDFRSLLISTTIWPPTNNSKNLTPSRSAQYSTCKSLSDVIWISHANVQC